MNCRLMQLADAKELAVLAQDIMPYAWSQQSFIECFSPGYYAWVLELKGVLIGFVIVHTVLDEAQLMNIGIAKKYQHQGHAHALLLKVLDKLESAAIKFIDLEVRASNQSAIHLYQKIGFKLINQRRGYYPARQGREDALVMRYILLA